MEIRPAMNKEYLDKEKVEKYIRHVRDLYAEKKAAGFRTILVPETEPITFSLARITNLPWKWPRAEGTYWQMKCFTKNGSLRVEKEYDFTDDGQLRFFRDVSYRYSGEVAHCITIELHTDESFASWERYEEVPEDGLGWCGITYFYDEDGNQIDEEWHGPT